MSQPGHPARELCFALLDRLSEYMDGELEAAVCSEIDEHMGNCPPCDRLLDSLRRTVGLVRTQPPPEAAAEIRRQVREAVARFRVERDG